MVAEGLTCIAMVAFALLLASQGWRMHRRLDTQPRLIVVLAAVTCTTAGLALLSFSLGHFLAGHAWRFGHSGIPATRAGTPRYFWMSTIAVSTAGAVLGALGLYLLRLSFMPGRKQGQRRNADSAAIDDALARTDRLLANPGAIAIDYGARDFGCSGRRGELLALARQHDWTLPEFSKSIYAAALRWYCLYPHAAVSDGVADGALADLAVALVALEDRQRSGPPRRADDHYRVLLAYGQPGCAWWEPVLDALAANAGRLDDALLTAESMCFVLLHAAPASAARALALGQLTQFLGTLQEPAGLDATGARDETFLVTSTNLAAPNQHIARLARDVYWERARSMRSRNDHAQFTLLMLAGMELGEEALAQQSVEALCSEFPKLATANVEAGSRAIKALRKLAKGGRAALVNGGLARVVAVLDAIDPQAGRSARRVEQVDEWWM